MSVKIMGQVWELDLPHNQLLVLLAMADHANHEGGDVFPSFGLIAWKTGYSYRQVLRIVEALEAAGLLVIEVEGKDAGTVNRYRINTAAGTLKDPYRDENGVTKRHTPPVKMSQGGVTQLSHTGYDTATSHDPSKNTSVEPLIVPDGDGAQKSKPKATPTLKTLADLKPLARTIAQNAFLINSGQGISKRNAIRINMVTGELAARFGDGPGAVTAEQLATIYGWKRSQKRNNVIPKDGPKTGDMVQEYRDLFGDPATAPADVTTGAPDPNCPTCGGAGWYTMDVEPEHPQFGKPIKCTCGDHK